MSGRRTSGSSGPSLGIQVLADFSFISSGKSQFKTCQRKRLEVPDILLPDTRGLLTLIFSEGLGCRTKLALHPPRRWVLHLAMVNSQKSLGEGAKGLLGEGCQRPLALVQKRELHWCKTGFGWCQRLLGDLCSLGAKLRLHRLLTTFVNCPFSGPLPGPLGRNP